MRAAALLVVLSTLCRVASASEVGCPARVVVESASATWYGTAVEGACSLPPPADGLYAAVGPADFAGSEACGRCALVSGPLGTVTVPITDLCPGCAAGNLDLSPVAFAAIGVLDDGIVPIAWETVACDVGETAMALEFENSNPYYLKVQVQNHRHGVASVEMQDGSAWVAMVRTFDDHFERTAGGPFAEPFHFRITSVHGQVVESANPIPLTSGVPLDTGVQFAQCPEPTGAAALAALAASLAIRSRRR
jgi:expansin